MATSITTTYAGEYAGKIIAAALLSADTIEGGGITVKPNVKYKEVMKTLSTNALVKDAACDFADQSTVTLAERILQPEEFQVNLELCKKDFHNDWEAIQMGYSVYFCSLFVFGFFYCEYIFLWLSIMTMSFFLLSFVVYVIIFCCC